MKHVLVVEDDPHNAVVFRKILEKRAGCRVTVITESAEEMMRCVAAGGIDLVIMDVSLASARWKGQAVSGVDLCRLLREDPRCAAIPIMIASAHAMRGDAERLLAESGANEYIAKPIVDHAAFVRQVQGLLEEAA